MRYLVCRTDKLRYSLAPTTSTDRGMTGFSTEAAAREHFGPFALARTLEEGITTSFGNNWQAIDIVRELFDHFFQMRLEIVI